MDVVRDGGFGHAEQCRHLAVSERVAVHEQDGDAMIGLQPSKRVEHIALHRGRIVPTRLDRQVDTMEPLLEDLEERISALEDRVLLKPGGTDLTSMLALKRISVAMPSGPQTKIEDPKPGPYMKLLRAVTV